MSRCRACGVGVLENVLELGPQPICNRFLSRADGKDDLYPFTIGICNTCRVVQLGNPPPPNELKPHLDWITYNEPEGHLDTMAKTLSELPGISSKSSIGGFTHIDGSLLGRLQKMGLPASLSLSKELGVTDPCASVDMWQPENMPGRLRPLIKTRGHFDLLLVRHVIEHVQDMGRFFEGLKELMNPNGFILFEAPENEKILSRGIYGALWEEHVFYFTQQTYLSSLESHGFEVVFSESFPYSLENSLVAIVKVNGKTKNGSATPAPASESARFKSFAENFPQMKADVHRVLKDAHDKEGRIAVFGASHYSGQYVNLFGIKSLVHCFIDDHPKKKNLFMPGSHSPIYTSEALVKENIRLCLLGVNPDKEAVIQDKNRAFLDKGGRFLSLNPNSSISLLSPQKI